VLTRQPASNRQAANNQRQPESQNRHAKALMRHSSDTPTET
jgi:hypothetical protein